VVKVSCDGFLQEDQKISFIGRLGGIWTLAKTVAVLLFSNLGIGLIHILSDYSLFLTYTHNVGSTVTKIAVFQLINSFAVPLLAIVGFRSAWQKISVETQDGEAPEVQEAQIGFWCGPFHLDLFRVHSRCHTSSSICILCKEWLRRIDPSELFV
jgi:hypothetical protein